MRPPGPRTAVVGVVGPPSVRTTLQEADADAADGGNGDVATAHTTPPDDDAPAGTAPTRSPALDLTVEATTPDRVVDECELDVASPFSVDLDPTPVAQSLSVVTESESDPETDADVDVTAPAPPVDAPTADLDGADGAAAGADHDDATAGEAFALPTDCVVVAGGRASPDGGTDPVAEATAEDDEASEAHAVEDVADTIDRIRTARPHLPIVALLADADPADRAAAFRAGASTVLPRSLLADSPDIVRDRVATRVRQARAETGYPALYDGVAEPLTLHDPATGQLVYANQALCELLGYDREAMLDMRVADYTADVPGYDQDRAMAVITSATEAGTVGPVEWPVETAAGERRWVESYLTPVRAGSRTFVLSTATDVTDRRQREREFEQIFNGVNDAITVHDPDTGEMLAVNDTFCDLVGYDRETVLDMEISAFSRDDLGYTTGRGQAFIQGIDADGADTIEWALETADGETRWVEVHGTIVEIGGKRRYVAIDRDITEAKRREREYEQIFNAVNDSIVIHDPDTGAMVDVNDTFCDLVGYDRETVLDLGTTGLSVTADGYTAERAREIIDEVMAEGSIAPFTWKVETATGEERVLEVTATRARIGGQQRHVSLMRDVTERQRLERTYRAVFDNSAATITLHEPGDPTIRDVNQTLCDLVGYDRETLLGTDPARITADQPGYDADRLQTVHERVAAGEEPVEVEWPLETATGETRWIEATLTPVRIEGDPMVLSTGREITEAKRRAREYEQIFDGVPDPITVNDPDTGAIVAVNDAMCETVGYDRERILEEGLDLVSATAEGYTGERARAIIDRVMQTGETETFEWKLETASGEERILEVTGSPARINGKKRYVSLTRDITERRRREREYEQIFDNVNDAITIHDPDTGAFVDVNDTLCDLLGYDRETIFELGIDGVSVTGEGYTAERAHEIIDRVMRTGEPITVEWKVETADGEHRWLEVNGTVATIGGQRRFISLNRDVTERKRREREYEQIFDNVTDAIAVHDPDTGDILRVNDTYVEAFGYDADRIRDLGIEGLSVTEEGYTKARAAEIVRRVAETGTDETVEWKVRTADGERRIYEVNVTVGEIGGQRRVLSINRDITERRRREREYEQIFDNVNDAIAVFDPDSGRITDVNAAYHDLLGYDSLERIQKLGIDGLSVTEAGYTGERGRQLVREVAQTGAPTTVEWQAQPNDGDRIWLEVTLAPAEIGGQQRVLSIQRDVTERKRREAMVRNLHDATDRLQDAETPQAVCEATVRAAEEVLDLSMPVCWLEADDDGRLDPVAASEAAWAAGDGPATFDPDSFPYTVFEGDDLVAFDPQARLADPEADAERAFLVPLGEHGLLGAGEPAVTSYDEVTLDAARILARHATSALDRVERARELRESEQRFRTIAQRVDEIIYFADADLTDVEYVNPAYADIYGRPIEELYEDPRAFIEAIHPEDRDRYTDHLDRMLAEIRAGEPQDSYDFSFRIQRPDGETRWLEATGYPILGEAGAPDRFVGLTTDVTERRDREERIEVLNRVLRHNLRNEMDVVKSYAEVLAADGPDREYAERIMNVADDLVALGSKARYIEELLTDAGGGDTQVARLTTVIDRAVAELESDFRAVDLEVTVADAVADTLVNQSLLRPILRELLENAVEHTTTDLPRVTVRATPATTAEHAIELAVVDDGPGIPEQELRTLASGTETQLEHGRGLGLWLVKWGIRRLNGRVEFDTDGEGTAVRLQLRGVDD